MDNQKSLLGVAEAQIARQAKALEAKRAIVAVLPQNLPVAPRLVLETGYKANGTVMFNAANREEVLTLLESLPPVPVILLDQGTKSFMPESKFVGEPGRGQSITKVHPFVYNVDTGVNLATSRVNWWTQLGDLLVVIRVSLPKDDLRCVRRRLNEVVGRNPGNSQAWWEFDRLPTGLWLRWHGSDMTTPPSLSIYWERSERPHAQLLLSSETHYFGVS